MISVTILTKNSSRTLQKTLESLRDFPEVLVYDNGSTDSTLEIAKKFSNVQIVQGSFDGFGKTHNRASLLAENDWILSVDSDEVLSKELSTEILQATLDPQTVYALRRDNYFRGKLIRCCAGWHPDIVARLYHRKHTSFSDDAVHEKVLVKEKKEIFQHPLLHTPYLAISDFLHKMQTYSTLFAEQNKGKKRSSIWTAVLHSWGAFLKSYIGKYGFIAGKEGFIISLYNGHVTFYKYLKLMEKNEETK